MAVTHGYLTLEAFKTALGGTGSARDADLERAIEAASRQIDRWYGGHFWRETTPTPRLFQATDRHTLWVGDFADTTGMSVATDEDGDGVFETVWSSVQWQAEPFVRLNGLPYRQVTAVEDRLFPVPFARWRHRHEVTGGRSRRPRVQVTAAWGWPAIPAEVRQACQILAVDHFKSKDLTGGVAGFGELGPIRIAAFNPQARALLEPFRAPVFA